MKARLISTKEEIEFIIITESKRIVDFVESAVANLIDDIIENYLVINDSSFNISSSSVYLFLLCNKY